MSAAPSSPNLMDFGDSPRATASGSAASAGLLDDPFAVMFRDQAAVSVSGSHSAAPTSGSASVDDPFATLSTARLPPPVPTASAQPSSPHSVPTAAPPSSAGASGSVACAASDSPAQLHFFVSCCAVDGNLVQPATRTAQTLMRGALSMLAQKSPRTKAPSEVAVEVRVAREFPVVGRENDAAMAVVSGGPPILESESYWSERRKSRNPHFAVGFNVTCNIAAMRDRHIQIMIMIPDENSASTKNAQVYGVEVSPVNQLKQFLFYRPSARSAGGEPFVDVDGWLRFELYHESYGIMSGIENQFLGEVVVPLQSIRDTMAVEEKTIWDGDEVLFTQGINEMQSLANMVGHSGVSIQGKINSTSLQTIIDYYKRFTAAGLTLAESHVGSHPDEILRNLRASVETENSASKNTCILFHAADAVRSLNGGRITYCKSGKDRTAMSVTLEQARLLVQRKRHVLQELLETTTTGSSASGEAGPLEEVKDAANTMREFGVRIEIAKKNVGRYKYSFNSLQRKLLPEIYRPPVSTIQDMVTSVTARDS
ncbi:hypothetical protein ATCC90586_001943 [Pythium insidiosum]|nr:hypothetical protein ATCC90586_001943 [Pythium insidiosum]